MKTISIPIKNIKGFLYTLLPFVIVFIGFIFLIFIFLNANDDELSTFKYLLILILLANLFFFYHATKSLCFTVFGNHEISYNDEYIIVNSSVFKISTIKKFKWDEVETVGGFSPKNKPGLSESIGIKPINKPIFFFGHLMKDYEKREIAKELYNFFKNLQS